MLNDAGGDVPSHFLDINMIFEDSTISKTFSESENFKKYQKEQYFKIRKTIYNEETLNNMIDTYLNYLKQNGAMQRDIAKWGNNIFEEECQIVKDHFKQRIDVLDNYYGGL